MRSGLHSGAFATTSSHIRIALTVVESVDLPDVRVRKPFCFSYRTLATLLLYDRLHIVALNTSLELCISEKMFLPWQMPNPGSALPSRRRTWPRGG